MAKGKTKVSLRDVKRALHEIARWTQAVQDELMAAQGSNPPNPALAVTTAAVSSAVAATLGAAAAAESALGAIGDVELATPIKEVGTNVRDWLGRPGVPVAKGC